jgi:hypothetical protein
MGGGTATEHREVSTDHGSETFFETGLDSSPWPFSDRAGYKKTDPLPCRRHLRMRHPWNDPKAARLITWSSVNRRSRRLPNSGEFS